MIQARVQQGRIECQDPLPDAWEGQWVKIVPLTPDDPIPDLEEKLAAFKALGPAEYEPGEREAALQALEEMNRISRDAMQRLANGGL